MVHFKEIVTKKPAAPSAPIDQSGSSKGIFTTAFKIKHIFHKIPIIYNYKKSWAEAQKK